MKPHETIAMLKAWQQWHNGLAEDEMPEVSVAFRKGFVAGLVAQADHCIKICEDEQQKASKSGFDHEAIGCKWCADAVRVSDL